MSCERGGIDQPITLHPPEFGIRAEFVCEVFSAKQREALKARDGGTCQFPSPHVCTKDKKLEEHHILPQGYSQVVKIEPDFAENGLTICSNAHDLIHPDRVAVRRNYHQNKRGFEQLRETRHYMLENKTIYWNPEFDRPMQVIALRNTQRAIASGNWHFPPKTEK